MLIEERVNTISDFKHLWRKSQNNLKLNSNQQQNPDFKNDCHLIIGLTIEKAHSKPSYVNFVRLASTDNLVERKSKKIVNLLSP